jgi:hypothetical protein
VRAGRYFAELEAYGPRDCTCVAAYERGEGADEDCPVHGAAATSCRDTLRYDRFGEWTVVRCTQPAGHDDSHDDGYIVWPRNP